MDTEEPKTSTQKTMENVIFKNTVNKLRCNTKTVGVAEANLDENV